MRLKKAVKIIAFCTMLIVCINRLYEIFSWKDSAGDYCSAMNSFYELEDDLVDVLFLGSSHCYCSINNAVLWDEQGISSFSLAISGQELAGTYHCFVEALKTQTPEVVCLEIGYGASAQGYGIESNMYRNTLPYRYSVNAVNVVREIAEDRQGELLLRWPIIHTRYAELKEQDFWKKFPVYVGYRAEFKTMQVIPLCTYFDEEMVAMEEETEAWLRKIIALAEENNIKMCLFVAPYVTVDEEQKLFNYVESLAQEHNIPFLNMTRMDKELQLDLTTDFLDMGHTNYYGAQKVSSYMGRYLKQNFELNDRRGQEEYVLWEENSRVRSHEYQNQVLKTTYDIPSYLNALANLQDYTIVVSTDGDYISLDAGMEECVYSLGLDGFYDAPGIWVINDGELVVKCIGRDMLEYMDVADDYLAVSRIAGVSSIIINKTNYAKSANGVNIVVYDNLLGEIVDAVALDVSNPSEIVR